MADDTVELKVRALPNATYDISTSLQTTVAGLKRILEEKTNTPQERQRLIYRGRILENNTTLAENSLQNGHTIHLVERSSEAVENNRPPVEEQTEPSETQSTTRIQVNVGTGTAGLNDLGRLVQEVLNAVVRPANAPNAAASPSDATNATPQRTPTSASGTTSVENVPHLLWSFGNYVSRMETGGVPTRTLPLFSLAPTDPNRPITPEQLLPLTTAICRCLSSATLDEDLRRQLEGARQALESTGNAAVESTAATPGASVCFRADGSTVHVQRTTQLNPPNAQSPAVQYPHLPLLVAAFGDLVQRTERLIREKALRSLNNAVRQFQSVPEIDESNQELLIGGLLQVGSVSHWYGALMAELGRIAAAIVPALNGNMYPLALNTASVISHDGAYPNFQPLFPRGMEDNQSRFTAGRIPNVGLAGSTPGAGLNIPPVTSEVSVSVGQSGMLERDNPVVPALQQVAAAMMEGGLRSAANNTNQPQQTTEEIAASVISGLQQTAETAPQQIAEVISQLSTEASPPASAPGPTTGVSTNRAPAGMGGGLRPRSRAQGTSAQRPRVETSGQQSSAEQGGEGRGSGLESLAASIDSGIRALGSSVVHLASNPEVLNTAENLALQGTAGDRERQPAELTSAAENLLSMGTGALGSIVQGLTRGQNIQQAAETAVQQRVASETADLNSAAEDLIGVGTGALGSIVEGLTRAQNIQQAAETAVQQQVESETANLNSAEDTLRSIGTGALGNLVAGLSNNPNVQQATEIASQQQLGTDAADLNSVAENLMGGGGGALGNLVGRLANNPGIRQMAESPAMQRAMGNLMSSGSNTPNLGRMMNEMGPVLSSFLGASTNRPNLGGDRGSNTGSLNDLPDDRVGFWNRIMQQDAQTMSSMSSTPAPLSPAYLAGRITHNSRSQILKTEVSYEEEDGEE